MGNMIDRARDASVDSVHPHVCGEYFVPMQEVVQTGRFTPTCVGNTQSQPDGYQFATVHPHVCGEYQLAAHFCVLDWVHPHVCGEYPVLKFLIFFFFRFTPTCVGNT